MISFPCSSCKQPIQIEDGAPGQEIRCFRCGKANQVPSRVRLMLSNPRGLVMALLWALLASGLLFLLGKFLLRRFGADGS